MSEKLPDISLQEVSRVFADIPEAAPFKLSIAFDLTSSRPYIDVTLSGKACQDIEKMRALRAFLANATGKKTPTHVNLSIGSIPNHHRIKIFPGYDMTPKRYVAQIRAHLEGTEAHKEQNNSPVEERALAV